MLNDYQAETGHGKGVLVLCMVTACEIYVCYLNGSIQRAIFGTEEVSTALTMQTNVSTNVKVEL